MDLNRDEYIDWTEFVAACIDLGGGLFDQELRRAFEDADSDGDGLLSQQDFSRLLAGRCVRGGGVGAGAAADVFADLAGRDGAGARLDWAAFLGHFRLLAAAGAH
ncbi:unnamed protein product [Prorocentrum cordatum]|uniref:EF-hand domain-containing protein n=1 Tax=Prorocentrum cordatum TaxID=2364126 RepID=A0ABN9VCU4_9DINO|nr:unnamed protein product [Polarella glacialis]